MTKIKICGLTNREDVEAACALGADAIGFIFVPNTPRYVGGDTKKMHALLQSVPPLVWRVGVYDIPPAGFVSPPELHAVQYYANVGGMGEAFAPGESGESGEARVTRIKAFRIKDEASLQTAKDDGDPKEIVLLDAYSPRALGGTGHTFNWELARRAKSFGFPVALAGGLTPENVGEAVRAVRPYMVDVSSGVEDAPGRKNHDKINAFIRAVREADLTDE